MPVLRDGPDVGEESGDAGPAEARNRPQVGGLLKVCQQGIDLGGHGRHLGREHINPRYGPLDFACEDVDAVGAGDSLLRVAVDLRQLEAPDSATGAVLAHTGHELPEGQGGHRGGDRPVRRTAKAPGWRRSAQTRRNSGKSP